MLKIAFGITIGYLFSDVIDEVLDAVKIGMHNANAKADPKPEEPIEHLKDHIRTPPAPPTPDDRP